MNNYSDLLDIDNTIEVLIELAIVGEPDLHVWVNENKIQVASKIKLRLSLLDPVCFTLQIKNKDYENDSATLVTVESISIDGINLIPAFNHLTTYSNDRQSGLTTNCLGFNGTWTFNVEQPFYQWLHQATGQGWLLQSTG